MQNVHLISLGPFPGNRSICILKVAILLTAVFANDYRKSEIQFQRRQAIILKSVTIYTPTRERNI